jgi:hypothetical protein
MRSICPSSLVRVITGAAVVLAVCGMSIRMPLPMNAAGAAARAKRARRVESAAEVAAKAALAEQTTGSICSTSAPRDERAGFWGASSMVRFLSPARPHRVPAAYEAASVIGASQRILPMRC